MAAAAEVVAAEGGVDQVVGVAKVRVEPEAGGLTGVLAIPRA